MPGFFDLSRELRNAIYEELLVLPLSCTMSLSNLGWSVTDTKSQRVSRLLSPAILLANKTTNEEATSLLYSRNRFEMLCSTWLPTFLNQIGTQNAGFLRHIRGIDFPAFHNTKGTITLDEDSTGVIDLIRDKCTDLRTLEMSLYSRTYVKIDKLGLKETEFFTLVAGKFEDISSLEEVTVHVYEKAWGYPSTQSIREQISALGWLVKVTDLPMEYQDEADPVFDSGDYDSEYAEYMAMMI